MSRDISVKDHEDIDCDYTKEVVCPYCGNEQSDSWEYGYDEEEHEVDCDHCERSFMMYVNTSVSYSSKRKDCKDDAHRYEAAFKSDTTWEDIERYKREGSCLAKYILEPERTWLRKCANCEDSETRKVKIGEECPTDLAALPGVDVEVPDAD